MDEFMREAKPATVKEMKKYQEIKKIESNGKTAPMTSKKKTAGDDGIQKQKVNIFEMTDHTMLKREAIEKLGYGTN